jgi:hypothetical protein
MELFLNWLSIIFDVGGDVGRVATPIVLDTTLRAIPIIGQFAELFVQFLNTILSAFMR